MDINVGEIIECTKGLLLRGESEKKIKKISTDSRKVEKGYMFIPLKGEKYDGHDFVHMAIKNGADIILVSKDMELSQDVTLIKVEDTLKAMHEIAKYYISKFEILKVAVTGSTGKTSTKDMLYHVLSKKYKVLKNKGNFNNHIGLPITVFELNENHEACILEMGMSGFGEINTLANIVRPHIGIISNIGLSHIENLGSQEGILKAKMEIQNYMEQGDTLIVNGDDKFLSNIDSDSYIVYKFGMNDENQIIGKLKQDLQEEGVIFKVHFNNEEYEFKLNVAGVHNIYNALSAIMVGLLSEIPMDKIQEGISEFENTKMRLNIKRNGQMVIIDDTYNASPDSMIAAIKVLNNTKNKRKIAILGDMLEMGTFAKKAHYDVGREVAKENINTLIAVGKDALYYEDGAKSLNISEAYYFNNNEEVIDFLNKYTQSDDAFLIKGSRGMAMEEIVKYLQERR